MRRRGYHTELFLLRAPVIADPYSGNETRDWDAAKELGPYPAAVQPGSGQAGAGQELTDRMQVTITRWSVNMPPVGALPTDRVRWRGDDYEVDGEVGSWPGSPRDHHEFTMNRLSSQ